MRSWWLAPLALVVPAGACGPPGATGEACDLAPGEVLVTELMVDPLGSDTTGEWVELHNPGGAPVVLDRAVLTVRATRTQTYELRGVGSLAPGGYFVAGNDPVGTGAADASYGGALDLENRGATVSVSCRGETVDSVSYGAAGGPPLPESGRSLSRDGGASPGITDAWCAGSGVYDGRNEGTPGAPNPTCGRFTCETAAGRRAVVAPGPGELVVSEVYADPPGTEAGKEWLELFVQASGGVDLNALVLETTSLAGAGITERLVVESASCLPAAGGEHVVIGASADPGANGGAPVDVVLPGLTLPNQAYLRLRLVHDSTEIDVATVPYAREGVSVRIDDARKSASADDDPASYCAADPSQDGRFQGTGTPGAANGFCGTLTCREAGVVREVKPPARGELVVSEVFAESARSPATRDWLELYDAGAGPFDVNGLTIVATSALTGTRSSATLASETCVTVPAGGYAVVGTTLDPALDGGVPVQILAPSLSLANEVPIVLEIAFGGALVDRASVPAAVAGKSASLDPARMSADADDDPATFCVSEAAGLFVESGTPGRPNLCGPTCIEGGLPRAVRLAEPGRLLLTEVFPDPVGADGGRDWLELLALADVDLNRLTLSTQAPGGAMSTWTLKSRPGDACVPVPAGRYGVVGGLGAATLGVIPEVTIGGAGDTLFPCSGDGAITLRALLGSTVIDEVAYPPTATAFDAPLHAGRSWAREGGVGSRGEAPSWCESTTLAEGFIGLSGTPGVANPDACP